MASIHCEHGEMFLSVHGQHLLKSVRVKSAIARSGSSKVSRFDFTSTGRSRLDPTPHTCVSSILLKIGLDGWER